MIKDTIMIFCCVFSTMTIAGTCLLLVTPRKLTKKTRKVRSVEKSVAELAYDEYLKLSPKAAQEFARQMYLYDKSRRNKL